MKNYQKSSLNCVIDIDRKFLVSLLNCKVLSAQKWRGYKDFVEIKLKIEKIIRNVHDVNAPEIILGMDFIKKFNKTKTA